MSREAWDFEAAIIGGGPAGACAAAALAQAGRNVVLFERETFPRFHIGESMLPYSNRVLRRIGFEQELKASDYTRKFGATFISEDGERTTRAVFGDPPACEETSTWQVRRADFDHQLLEHAKKRGADIRQANVVDVRFDEHSAYILHETDGEQTESRVGAVLDATGRAGIVARRLGLRKRDPDLHRLAVFSHFKGVRCDAANPGDIRIVSRGDMGWWWFIPLDEETTSVGVVFQLDERLSAVQEDADAFLQRMIDASPATAELMADAESLAAARFEGDYSYSTSAYSGDRWMLLGDAGSFIDPVFSTGVHVALGSAMEAAEALNDALGWGSKLQRAPLARYDRRQRMRYRFFRRLVLGFYDPGFRDLFFAEKPWLKGYHAVVMALAGNDQLPFSSSVYLRVFLLLSKLQNRFALVPRIHGVRADELIARPPISLGRPARATTPSNQEKAKA